MHVENKIDHEMDEHLEVLYHLRERHHLDLDLLKQHMEDFNPQAMHELVQRGHITVDGASIQFTEAGFRKAEKIIRQHRLAERLLADVLHMSPSEVERGACEFEHIVAEEITESICILLGHPRTCPHGSPIPQGPCCRAYASQCTSIVAPLTDMPLGETARIAYVNTVGDDRQHRLANYGVIPGNTIKLHQRKPSVVVVLDGSRLAMESGVARDIQVWKSWQDEPAPKPGVVKARRLFWK